MKAGLKMAYLFLGAGLLLPSGFFFFPGEPAFQIAGSTMLTAAWVVLGRKSPDRVLPAVMTLGSSLWLIHHAGAAAGCVAYTAPLRLNAAGMVLYMAGGVLMMTKGGVRIIPVLWEVYSMIAFLLALGPREAGPGVLRLSQMKLASCLCALSWLAGCVIMISRGGWKMLDEISKNDEHVAHYQTPKSHWQTAREKTFRRGSVHRDL